MVPGSDSSSTISSLYCPLSALRPGSYSGQAARRPRARESSAVELDFPRLVIIDLLSRDGGVAVITYKSLELFGSKRFVRPTAVEQEIGGSRMDSVFRSLAGDRICWLLAVFSCWPIKVSYHCSRTTRHR